MEREQYQMQTVPLGAGGDDTMEKNVGRADQVARLMAGPALLILGYSRMGGREGRTLGLLAMMSGVSLIESAITRICPVSALLGIDTRTTHEKVSDRNAALGLETESVSDDRALELAEELTEA
jgi:hypothetical protein